MKKIVFTTDLLRVQNEKFFDNHILRWAYPLMGKQIEYALGEISLYSNETKENFDTEKFYSLCGYELTTENWIKICTGKYSQEALDYFHSCFKDCIVITQEAGSFRDMFEKLNIPYVDFYISAVRFCSDLFFAFRSNIPEIREKLKSYKVPEKQFYIEAGILKAHNNKRGHLSEELENNSLLLCGQTSVDLSLIKDDKLVSFKDYMPLLEELFSKYNKVYYKPHPNSKPESETEVYIRSLENVELINTNTYKLLSCNNITAVAALSSGILTEAKYFGKEIHTISHTYASYWNEEDEISSNDFITVRNEYRNPMFWANILSPIVQNVNYINIDFPSSDNFLRNTLGLYWGYENNYTVLKHNYSSLRKHFANNSFELYNLIIKRTKSFKDLRKIISLFIPFKNLRKIIRGDY